MIYPDTFPPNSQLLSKGTAGDESIFCREVHEMKQKKSVAWDDSQTCP